MLVRGRVVVTPDEDDVILSGGIGFVGKLNGEENGGAFAIGEHPLEPGILAAPPHTQSNEDEISYVLEGEIGVLIGEEVHRATAGSYVLKPRGVPHTFWKPWSRAGEGHRGLLPRGVREVLRGIPSARLSENPQARASLLTMSLVIAAWMKVSPVEHILS